MYFIRKRKIEPDRPIIRPEMTPLDWIIEIMAIAGLMVLWGVVIYSYPQLPRTIPNHFSASGQADQYGSKDTVWLLPCISVFLYTLLTLINLVPYKFNYLVTITPENALRQYTIATRLIRSLKCITIWVFFFITLTMMRMAGSQTPALGLWFIPVLLGLTFLPIIIYLVLSSRRK
jgi:uncharacterized membrane protein